MKSKENLRKLKIKVCGMKESENIKGVCKLNIDYIGLNFYEKSPRYIGEIEDETISSIPSSVKKVGVFVDETLDRVIEIKKKYNLDYVQLHGDESAGYCKYLYVHNVKVIKAFRISDGFDFLQLHNYDKHCSYFLFDNKSNAYGGSGEKFNWEILKKYDNTKIPYFLSGGIGIEDVDAIKEFRCHNLNIYGLDINSRFESEPAIKDLEKVKKFLEQIS